MDYRDEVFISVAESLSFSRAAKELYISQPAVTKHIKELESRLNTTLFLRKGNKIYLTTSGKVAYSKLKEIRSQYRELEFELGQLSGAFKGELRVGASSTIGQYLIPKVLAEFHQRYPEITLHLYNGNSTEIEQKLIDGEVDVALVENSSSQSDIRYRDLTNDNIVAITDSKSVYARKRSITVADLPHIPIVLRERGSGTLEVISDALSNHSILLDQLNIFIHLGSTEAIKNFMESFDGVALVSERAVIKELQSKIVTKLDIKGVDFSRKFRTAVRYGNETKLQKLFLGFICDYSF